MYTRKLLYIFLILSSYLFFTSCKKTTDSEFKPKTTDLKITVVNNDDSLMGGMEVFIYKNKSAFLMRKGEVAKDTTDSNGEVTFTDLVSQNYYFYVRKFEDTTYWCNYHVNGSYSDFTHYNFGDVLIQNSLTSVKIPVNQMPYPKKFELISIHKVINTSGGVIADTVPFFHYDLYSRNETDLGTSLLVASDDFPSANTDNTFNYVFDADLFYSNYEWEDSTMFLKLYKSKTGDRSTKSLVNSFDHNDFFIDVRLDAALVRFIYDGTYGCPVKFDDDGNYYIFNIAWY